MTPTVAKLNLKTTKRRGLRAVYFSTLGQEWPWMAPYVGFESEPRSYWFLRDHSGSGPPATSAAAAKTFSFHIVYATILVYIIQSTLSTVQHHGQAHYQELAFKAGGRICHCRVVSLRANIQCRIESTLIRKQMITTTSRANKSSFYCYSSSPCHPHMCRIRRRPVLY